MADNDHLLASDRRKFLRAAAAAAGSSASLLGGAAAAEARPRITTKRESTKCKPNLARRASTARGGYEPIATRSVLGYSRLRAADPQTKATYRTYHRVSAATSQLVLAYGNSATQTYAGANTMLPGAETIAVRAAIEVVGGGTTIALRQASFSGSSTGSIKPGGLISSDPIDVTLTAGQALWIRTEVSSPTGQWPIGISMPGGDVVPWTPSSNPYVPSDALNVARQSAALTNVDYLATAPDGTATQQLVPTSGGTSGYSPVAVLGKTAASNYQSTLFVGDSILNGTGETPYTDARGYQFAVGDLGFGARAFFLDPAPRGYLRATMPGDSAHLAASMIEHLASFQLARHCGNALVNYGRNDITTAVGVELAKAPGEVRLMPGEIADAIGRDLLRIWTLLRWAGLRVIQTTITPRTADVALHADTRAALNAWLRNGAPYDPRGAGELLIDDPTATSPWIQRVAQATPTGAADLSSAHPLRGVIDVAANVEGAWAASYSATDGTHPNSAGHHQMALAVRDALGFFG